ncbi:MAG TPA: multicopper oxidase domain-containing protein [Pyrinomonadaceae bacterium]|jgi:FtsP/CotA-like multicopper oxidase with cupredoxin domain|nr:multicopper oxidase domain-containing protein [Pyrinomonadaceae bacterium]
MANISKRNRRREKEVLDAAKNRRELIAAQFSRRDLMKMGLLTSTGMLIHKMGLSARAQFSDGSSFGQPASPPTTPFMEEMPLPPVAQPVTAPSGPTPTAAPNRTINPATGLPFEGRTRDHQAYTQFAPQKFYEVHQREATLSVHPQLPPQKLWTFNGTVPGQTYVARYGEPILVRNFNDLPANNGGFGIQSVTTHLHNGHTPSESDGFPTDFFAQGQYYDHHYPNVLAGVNSTHVQQGGDINESLSTLWYHDHRVDFTAQNTYKGLVGFYLLFNQLDTGNESTGFRLPQYPDFDIPMMFNDRNFDPTTKLLTFDLANRDGILGDKFLVNGKIQPFFRVKRRRYRFRWLNSGPSRFYQLFLTNPANLSAVNRFHVISNDGNLLPNPVQVSSVMIAVAERMDVIIDFSAFPAGTVLRIENRLRQTDGAGPSDRDSLFSAGQGNQILEFRVQSDPVTDGSVNPATVTAAVLGHPYFYSVPPRQTVDKCRQFKFDRDNGQWVINDKLFTDDVRFRVKRNTAEQWNLEGGFDWSHPVHIHFEEHQIIQRNRSLPTAIERGRKDVVRLGEGDDVQLFFRFRDFVGRYPMHCHNVVHEDHAMMLRFEIDDVGNNNESCDSRSR